MKPTPAPHVPGKNDWERFDNAMRKVLSVSKADAVKANTISAPSKPKQPRLTGKK